MSAVPFEDLSPDILESHLEYVLDEENLSFEKDALWHLAKAGRGSVRDSMTLLDQADLLMELGQF